MPLVPEPRGVAGPNIMDTDSRRLFRPTHWGLHEGLGMDDDPMSQNDTAMSTKKREHH